MLKLTEAKFITSAPTIREALPPDMSEVAVMGRSNVGKSSFINAITNRKNLAKSSSTPGKTRLINFFEIVYLCGEEKRHARLVDLPGFGYAKVSKSEKKLWEKALTEFITERSSIRLFIHLIDARHPDMAIDKEVREYLEHIKRPDQEIVEIFTKSDKLNQKETGRLLRDHPGALLLSNLKKRGIEKANAKIFESLFQTKCEA
ncbi:MAG: YihA family ribosome biogenesis GTP-binding protein [Campylobacteraceae bacterium 4484_4]|nr:MAG: YihA family ribosome biogenesis GTP-binding protein [Campylobacteraceae bacterium 4484_4]